MPSVPGEKMLLRLRIRTKIGYPIGLLVMIARVETILYNREAGPDIECRAVTIAG
jgi:hypothetical protein